MENNKGKHTGERIIQPFKKALNELQDKNLIEWKYRAKGDKPLIIKQTNQLSWNKFEQANIYTKIL
jgi:hypothetical protein